MNTNLFGTMQRATKKAFDRVGKVVNVEPDPDLAMYKTLKAQDFTALMKVYGEQDIVNYIRDMESKSIMNGRK